MSDEIKSFDELAVGQIVRFVDDLDPDRNGTYRVAFIDPPEAILKPDDDVGWPRISWQGIDFHAQTYRLVTLERATE